jgi:3-hydroxy-9,10-secoandrosta-1,3,5(10)-triene-9,17-dione monooxygenase
MVELGAELGRGCGSSAWVFTNLAGQSTIVGMHHPRAQEDVWGDTPDALVASSFPAAGATVRRVDGGVVLNGTWSFASGIDFAQWQNLQLFIPTETGPPQHRFALAPRADVTVVDDWYSTGLSGTGSRSVKLEDVFIPDYRILDPLLVGTDAWPARNAGLGPLFRLPAMSGAAKFFSSVAIGIARGALELVEEELRTRRTAGGTPMAELPTAQARLAESAAEIDAAFALSMRDADEAMRRAEARVHPPLATRARWRRNNAFAGQLCLRAIERAHPLMGARGLGRASLFQLASRDIHSVVQQITMAWDLQLVNAGRIQLGLPPAEPRL